MKIFLTIVFVILMMITCYYINRHILKIHLKAGHIYDWTLVNTNIIMSITIIPSIFYWIIVLFSKIPKISEKPPKWL